MSESEVKYVTKDPTKISANPITQTKSQQTKYYDDFDLASVDYWTNNNPRMVSRYLGGKIVGNYGHDTSKLKDYFKSIFSMIKESMMIQLAKNGYVGNELKTQFTMLNTTLDLIHDTIVRVDTDKQVDVDELVAFMHGFVNSYVNKTKHTED